MAALPCASNDATEDGFSGCCAGAMANEATARDETSPTAK